MTKEKGDIEPECIVWYERTFLGFENDFNRLSDSFFRQKVDTLLGNDKDIQCVRA